MLRNTTTAQKRSRDFHKSDALAQANQMTASMTTFLHGTENIKKFFCPRSKIREKNPAHDFLDFVLFFNIAVEKFDIK